MLHSKHVTVSANTTQANPEITSFKVNQGVIARVWITFPSGCAGFLRLRVFHQGHPIIPVDADAYLNGNDYVYEIPLMYEIKTSPELIIIHAWNLDDTNKHTFDIQVLIIDKKWIQPVGAYAGVIAALRSIFKQPMV